MRDVAPEGSQSVLLLEHCADAEVAKRARVERRMILDYGIGDS